MQILHIEETRVPFVYILQHVPTNLYSLVLQVSLSVFSNSIGFPSLRYSLGWQRYICYFAIRKRSSKRNITNRVKHVSALRTNISHITKEHI